MNPDGEIEACFACDPRYTGYDGYLHGGVISSLLDGAMTNWLLASGRRSMTADLSVRFQRPVVIGEPVDIRAHLEQSRRAVDVLQAELLQQGQVCATAVGKFMKHPDAR